MELDEAREIAKDVVPGLLFDLPKEIKIQLVKPGENEESLLSQLVEKAASRILRKATALENQKYERYV